MYLWVLYVEYANSLLNFNLLSWRQQCATTKPPHPEVEPEEKVQALFSVQTLPLPILTAAFLFLCANFFISHPTTPSTSFLPSRNYIRGVNFLNPLLIFIFISVSLISASTHACSWARKNPKFVCVPFQSASNEEKTAASSGKGINKIRIFNLGLATIKIFMNSSSWPWKILIPRFNDALRVLFVILRVAKIAITE